MTIRRIVRYSDMTVRELVEYLDEAFPHRCILRDQSLTEAHREAGKRDLVDHLLFRLHQEENNAKDFEVTVR